MSQVTTISHDLLAARNAVAKLLEQLASVAEHLRGNPHPDPTQREELNRLIAETDSCITPVRSDLNEACPKRPNDHDEVLQATRAVAAAAAPFFRGEWDPNSLDNKAWLARVRGFTESFRVRPERYPRLDHEVWQATLRRAEKGQDGKPTAGTGQNNEPHPDGPQGGRWVWWKGDRHEVPAGNISRLIAHFWRRTCEKYVNLTGPVFKDAVYDQTIRSTVSKTNAVLRRIGIGWGLIANSRDGFVTKGSLKPLRVKKQRTKRPKKRTPKPTR